ncbi:bifunctional diaminohydroxyphosphoribosylaminopyrimidine deaminase/5-amino-6-(5-phosphoribosylamino)uracil reductase RibD [Flavobacterium sp. UBA6135]|uniref:bifunctional diaminohydroxyphosphoribosylaminopyrimidine deaminase/5-amino-6-(5-phosphoribosylamino)uracil reductase RibD n=1 Tax=Flavobacterium sp. UBA6135 TaxID=1946553 RepID=UPI0025BB6903|nr:bifunctional diaminohydroxyphosphoribosylaminopyrimidine deaminase/5-amino-6-(5-phosphoribosylamino)uracil reductase RibD [Flavobacterium sp. UBA6135]
MSTHEFFMKRCIQLAKNGLGTTYPNPLVGSVIVHDGKIIGEGWHQKAGGPHAEVHAMANVKDKSLLKNATIYVSLEPCSHFGKTPPCCDLIIANEIPTVVIGTKDPFAKVDGNGIKKLQEAGKKCIVGVLEKECAELNKRFFTFHQKKRPYIILKWAQTADGYIAPLEKMENRPVWISSHYSRQLVHKWRTEEQAVLVGTTTALDDNPKLDARDWKGNNPTRIVVDRENKVPNHFHLKNDAAKTIVITAKEISNATTQMYYESAIFDKSLVNQITTILFKHEIQSVIIEGGTKTIQQFIHWNLWDEARIFKSKFKLQSGIKAPIFENKTPFDQKKCGDDELLIVKNYD